ncbi:MAG: PqqD family protein [Vicinamibacteria bacterium]|nr:PqqD family protein [Vicinamibacteria bacterium]
MTSPRLERTPDLIERKVADETFLLPVRGALANTVEMFALSEVGQFIWSCADGTKGVQELIDAVLQEFDVPVDQAQAEVAEFIGQLKAYGLISEVQR